MHKNHFIDEDFIREVQDKIYNELERSGAIRFNIMIYKDSVIAGRFNQNEKEEFASRLRRYKGELIETLLFEVKGMTKIKLKYDQRIQGNLLTVFTTDELPSTVLNKAFKSKMLPSVQNNLRTFFTNTVEILQPAED